MKKILIPTPLRAYTDGQDEINIENAQTASQALKELITRYEDIQQHLYDENNQLRKFVNIFINEDDIRHLEKGADTPLSSSDVISIVPSIAGG